MSKIIKILSLLLILSIACETLGGNGRPEPDCVTPDDALGTCVSVQYCVTIMTAIVNGDHLTNPEVAKFLRESQCGIERNSQKVCCHINSIDFGETPTINYHHESTTPVVIPVNQNPFLPSFSTLPPIIPPPPSANPIPSIPSIIEPPLPSLPPIYNQDQPKIFQNCGKLEQYDEPLQWIAALWYKHNKVGKALYESRCLGTVITNKHVIVPAHCVASLPAHLSLDHLTIRNDEYLIGKIFVHASYNQPKFANDIAIIELDVELSQSRNHRAGPPQQINNAICLDELDVNAHHHSRSTVGYMKTEQGPFRQVKIAFIPNNQCSMFFDQQFTDLTSSQFCANIQSNETDISPFIGAVIMTYDNARQQYSLKGFTSTVVRTEQSFDESKPFIFTDVKQYMNWIRSALGGSGLHSTEITHSNQQPHDDSLIDDRKILDTLKECQLSAEKGRCVYEEHCTLHQTEVSGQQNNEFLKSLKCSTGNNNYHEDGVCCPEKFVNSSALQRPDFDVRFKTRQGADLLDMNQCGQVDPTRRIVGGRQADLREFPWFALLKYKYGQLEKFTCGGSVISNRYVLTCAHCITQLPNGYKVTAVRLGEHDLRTDPDCKYGEDSSEEKECNLPVLDVDIEDLIPHPKYNNPRYSNDIGLVRMAEKVDFSRKGIIPICLPINNEMQQYLSNKSTVAGFGFTEEGRESDVLLKIVVPKVPIESCQSFHRAKIQLSEGHACYGGEGIIDSCKGDSGAPLLSYAVVRGKLKAIQMGIVAAGHAECGRGATGFPGIYTDVPKYMNWILDNLYEN